MPRTAIIKLIFQSDVFSQSFKSDAAGLYYRYGNRAGFTGLNIRDSSGFTSMRSAKNLTLVPVFQFSLGHNPIITF